MADEVTTTTEAPAATTTTETAAAAVTTTGQDWRTSLPDDLRAERSLADFKDVGGLAKSYVESIKLRGRSIPMPPENATPEQIASWKTEHGSKVAGVMGLGTIPAEPGKYELKQPTTPGLPPINDGLLTTAKAEFHKMGYTQDQAQGALELHAKILHQAVKWADEQNIAAIEGFRAQWGDAAFEQSKADSERGIFKLAEWRGMDTGKVREWLDKTRKGNDPVFFQLMAGFGELTGEDSIAGTGSGAAATPSSIREKGDVIRRQLQEAVPGSARANQLEADLESLYKRGGR